MASSFNTAYQGQISAQGSLPTEGTLNMCGSLPVSGELPISAEIPLGGAPTPPLLFSGFYLHSTHTQNL